MRGAVRAGRTAPFRRPFGWLHLGWALLVVAACVVLLTTDQSGHPPAMILVPPVLAAGVLGHLLWLLVAWLLGRGRARLERIGAAAGSWPFELTLIAVALGLVVSAVSVAWLIAALDQEGAVGDASLWLSAIVASHATAFVLLLLRRDAARFLIAAVASGWALALAWQLRRADPALAETAIAALAVVGLSGVAVYVLRARRIRSALG